MSHEVLRWLHVLSFALWFGTDLGVFTASLAVTDARLSIDTRRYALRLLMALDLIPRFAMLAVVAFGPWLAQPFLGSPVPDAWWMGWTAAIGLWGWLVFRLHHARSGVASGAASGADAGWLVWGRRLDWAARWLLVVACLWAAAQPVVRAAGAWLSLKLCLLAVTVLCGLAVRVLLVPFGRAFGELLAAGSTPTTEAALRLTMGRSRRCVLGIYVCVLLAAWLGIAKPAWP